MVVRLFGYGIIGHVWFYVWHVHVYRYTYCLIDIGAILELI